MEGQLSGGQAGLVVLLWTLFGLALYGYIGHSLHVISRKTGRGQAWMAWVPIAQLVLLCAIAEKPTWWAAILLLVPCVNYVFLVLVMMEIAEVRGKPRWVGLLVLVPCAQIVLPGYLAFID